MEGGTSARPLKINIISSVLYSSYSGVMSDWHALLRSNVDTRNPLAEGKLSFITVFLLLYFKVLQDLCTVAARKTSANEFKSDDVTYDLSEQYRELRALDYRSHRVVAISRPRHLTVDRQIPEWSSIRASLQDLHQAGEQTCHRAKDSIVKVSVSEVLLSVLWRGW